MQSSEIRPASSNDLPDILALLRDCQLLESGVAEALGDFLLTRQAGKLLGCAGLEVYGERGLLRSVAVTQEARQLGLGRRLVEGVIAVAKVRGLRELFLLTTTAPTFFARLGFVSTLRASVPPGIAESWEFKTGCPDTASPMWLALGVRS